MKEATTTKKAGVRRWGEAKEIGELDNCRKRNRKYG